MSHDPSNPHDPKNTEPTWEQTIAGAEKALHQNPVGMSRAEKQLLRTHWGEAEFRRRYQSALEHSGQLNMKVTVRPEYTPGATNAVFEYEGRQKPGK